MLENGKGIYVRSELSKCGNDSKKQFALLNNMLGRTKQNPLPEGSNEELAENFADYFLEKIKKLGMSLINMHSSE